MTYKVTPSGIGKINLNENDTVSSVIQNISVILSTPKGSCSGYREFGVDYSFMDRPAVAAHPLMVAAVKEAIDAFEPRAEFVALTFEDPGDGRLLPTVEVEIIGEES